jgi:glutathione synthase/RimK-type ligase-like ATP-grasp enzyme
VTGRAPRLVFAASPEALDLDDGWPLLRAALAAAGADAEIAVWEDTGVDWSEFDLVAANYTWGYVTRRERFLAWVDAVAPVTRLANEPAVVRWNSDKAYLVDLAAAGVPTVPTIRVRPGEAWEPPGADYVVKPAVASGGIGASRYVRRAVGAARRHVGELHADGQTALIQPYLPAVDADGEIALVFFGERFSHAVAKGGVLAPDAEPVFGLWERQAIAPRAPREDELALAARALASVRERFGATVYARVDLVDGADGRPVVMELELVEPTLFLDREPAAAPRFADALLVAATAPRRAPAPAARRGTG